MEIITHYHQVFNSPIFWLYIACVLVDIILGNIQAFKNNDIDSSVGVKGSIKHFGLFAFVVLFLPTLSIYLGDNLFSTTIVAYFIYQYVISIIENLGEIGFPLPDSLKNKFRRLGSQTYDVNLKNDEESLEMEIKEKKNSENDKN